MLAAKTIYAILKAEGREGNQCQDRNRRAVEWRY